MGEFFTEPVVVSDRGKDVKRVPCKLCDQQLIDGGGTMNLLNHLWVKHPEQYKCCIDNAIGLSSKQTALVTTFRECSPQCAATTLNRIAEFVASDLHPLSIIDSDGFKQLVNYMYLEPGYSKENLIEFMKLINYLSNI